MYSREERQQNFRTSIGTPNSSASSSAQTQPRVEGYLFAPLNLKLPPQLESARTQPKPASFVVGNPTPAGASTDPVERILSAKTYYQILEVHPQAETTTIKSQFRKVRLNGYYISQT